MLPSTHSRRSRPNESGWMLLPKAYVYIGAMVSFLFGCLLGNGWQQMQHNPNIGSQLSSAPNAQQTVLVTGGLGFIGSHVCEDLLAHGFNVVIFDDMSNGRNFNKQASAILLRDITVLSDFSFINTKIHYVIHLAAAISVPESVRLPEKYVRINVEGSRRVLEWAATAGVRRVVAASSAATYGVPSPDHIPLLETYATGGQVPYSQTKFQMESLMHEFSSQRGLPTTALRFFNVYGPRQDPKSDYSGVISWFMDQAHMDGTVKITGDGLQYRDFVFVKDVARAIRTAMLLPSPEFDVFNVCTQVKTTVNQLAQEIVEVFQSKAKIVHEAPRDGDVKESLCSAEKASRLLGFTAEFSLAQGLKQTHDWFMETQ